MSDIFTGQIIKYNFINPCGRANTVCLLKPLLIGQNYQNLTQGISSHIVSDIFTGQIIKQNCINNCGIANTVAYLNQFQCPEVPNFNTVNPQTHIVCFFSLVK